MKLYDVSDGACSSRGGGGGATACDRSSLATASNLLPPAAPPLRQTLRSSSEFELSFDDIASFDGLHGHTRGSSAQPPPPLLDFHYNHSYRTAAAAAAYDQQHVTQLTPIAQRYDDNDYGGGFFHLQTYGALRKGGPVALLSYEYFGYALSAAWSGYVYVMIEFVLTRVAPERLGMRNETARGMRDLLHLQWSVVLALGLLSDACAPFRLRRNAYILGGWVLVSVCFSALFGLLQCSGDVVATPPSQALSAAAVACITGAMLFLVVLTNATDIRIVELAQQEELATRGQLVATYQILRIGAQACAHTLVKLSLPVHPLSTSSNVQLDVSPLTAKLIVLHLAVLALVPIPFVVHHAFEPRRSSSATTQFRETCRQFLRSAQQRAIWQLVAFNCVLYFFSFLEYKDVTKALGVWMAQPPPTRLTQSLVSDIAFTLALVCWRSCGGVRAPWRKLAAAVIVSWSLVYLTGNALVALSVLRPAPWLPVLLSALKAPFRVLLLLSAFVPTVEVAQLGSEGTIYGLLSSFQSVVKVLGAQLVDAVVDEGGEGIAVDAVAVTEQAPGSGSRVLLWLVVLTSLKLLALVALVFCPQQKLDAQQRRIYGGYSKLALVVFLAAYALSYSYASYSQYAALFV